VTAPARSRTCPGTGRRPAWRYLARWAGWCGSDPVRYSEALAALRSATGPVTIDLPGHVLAIAEARERGQ
jgi:hypothetical protein